MAIELDGLRSVICSLTVIFAIGFRRIGPRCRVLAVEPQGQALGAAPRLDELIQFDKVTRESVVAELGGEIVAPRVDDDMAPYDHGIARKPLGFRFDHFDQVWHMGP